MSSVSPCSTPHNIELLRTEIDSLAKLNHQITDIELEKKIETVTTLGQSILVEYSKRRALDEISDLMIEMKGKIQEINIRLQKSESKAGRVQIIFTTCIVKTKGATKQKPIQEREFIKTLSSSLTKLEENINEMQTFGIVVDHFKKHSSFPEKLAIGRDKFISALFGFLVNKVSKQIFLGHQPQVILLRSKQELASLEKVQNSQNEGIKLLDEKVVDLDKREKKLATPLPSQELTDIQEKIIQEKIKLQQSQQEIKEEIRIVKEKINQLEIHTMKGKETRINLHNIGGTNIKINIPTEDVTLDGMYISSDSFKKTLKEGGALSYELSFKSTLEEGKKVDLKGIAFPAHAEGEIVDKALTSLGAFGLPGEPGAGWQKLYLEDGVILLITDEEADKLRQMNIIQQDEKLADHPKWSRDLKYNELTNRQSEEGTVLLTSGNEGVYEMHKREILAFLMRGMNVMTFNFRGYGESTGKPSGEGLKRDMEAAYQYLKKTHHISDEKILIKALCMSGGPAANLAGKHPKVNLFIDQSYANFDALVDEKTKDFIKNFAAQQALDPSALNSLLAWGTKNSPSLVHAVTKLAAPAWSIEKEIGKVKGHVGILLTKQDDLISLDRDIYKNYESALKSHQAQSVSLFSMEGEHGESWLNALNKTDLIKYVTVEEAQKMVSEIKKEGKENITDIESYSISLLANKQTDKKIKNLAKQYPEQDPRKIEILLKFISVTYQEELKQKIKELRQKDNSISKSDLENIIKKQLEIVEPEFRSITKQFLEEYTIKRDRLQMYKFSFLPNNQIIEKIEKITSQYPDIEPFEIKENLKSILNTYKTGIQKGEGEILLNALLAKMDSTWKPIFKQFLEECAVKQDPFIGIYTAIRQDIQNESLSPIQIEQLITKRKNSLPKNMQDQFQVFIYKAIQIPVDVINDPNFQQQRYEGRIQMDQYLQKAKLMGSLI